MAILCFSKKKTVAKREWKSFTKKVRSKFRELKIAASVRDSTSRLIRVISHRIIVPCKTRYLQNTSHRHSYDRRQVSRFLEFFSRPFVKTKYRRRHGENNYWQICEYQTQRWEQPGGIRSVEKVLGRKKEKEKEEGPQEIVDSVEEAWRRLVAASPHLRVDERADEFIYKIREEMRMEKERSFLEFQERDMEESDALFSGKSIHAGLGQPRRSVTDFEYGPITTVSVPLHLSSYHISCLEGEKQPEAWRITVSFH